MRLVLVSMFLPLLLACSVAAEAPRETATPTLTFEEDVQQAREKALVQTCKDFIREFWFDPRSESVAVWHVSGDGPQFQVTGIAEIPHVVIVSEISSGKRSREHLITRETATCNFERVTGDWTGGGTVHTEHGIPDPSAP